MCNTICIPTNKRSITLLQYLAIVSFLCGLFCPLIAQNTTIDVALSHQLKSIPAPTNYILIRHTLSPAKFQGMPENISDYRIFNFDLQTGQAVFQRFLRSEMTATDSTIWERISMKPFSYTPIRVSLAVYSGLKNGEKVIIPDLNHNHSFSDDPVLKIASDFELVVNDFEDNIPNNEFRVNYDFFDGQHVIPSIFDFELQPSLPEFLTDDANPNTPFYVNIKTNSHHKGTLRINGNTYQMAATPRHRERATFDNCAIAISLPNAPFLPKYGTEDLLKNGDLTEIEGKFYEIQVDKWGEKMSLIPQNKPTATRAAPIKELHFAPPINATTINNTPFELARLSGNYVVLDFWGTWCQPCLKELPHLVDLHKKYENRNIEFVSVASDNNLEKVRQYIHKYDLAWTHLHESPNAILSTNSIVKSFNVNAFPTVILINPEGYIIAEGSLTDVEHALRNAFR